MTRHLKTTNRDFEQFKAEFLRWTDKLGLHGYQIYFELTKLDGYAQIYIDEEGKCATVRLTTEVSGLDAEYYDFKKHAKHEAIHLLLNRMRVLGYDRYLPKDGLEDEWEKLVRVLEKVL